MTDPCGRSFLSYRRMRAAEAALLVAALHDHGIPTWQDIENLDEEHTEAELRRVLTDPGTANAILWITPEVRDSHVIRKIEAPAILARAQAGDAFFAIPVAAGGLDYASASSAIDEGIGLTTLAEWNVRKINVDPITDVEAAHVAQRVLRRRLRAIHQTLANDEPLRLGVYARAAGPLTPRTGLSLDWARRFTGRHAPPEVWRERLLPALAKIVETIRIESASRRIEATGLPTISAAVALGAAFLAPAGVPITWRQQAAGVSDQFWSLDVARESAGFMAQQIGKNVTSDRLAVLVSVIGDAAPALAASLSLLGEFRAIVLVRPSAGQRCHLGSPGQALDVALTVIEAIRDARNDYRPLNEIHLFLAVPVGLAMLIGQMLNTFGPVQLYEHNPVDTIGRYDPSVRLQPSV